MLGSKNDKIASYFASTNRISSIDDVRAAAVLSNLLPVIESIAGNLTQNSRSRSGSEVHIKVDDGDNGGKLASARRDPHDGSFHIVITVALLHRIFIQTQNLQDMRDRKYRATAFVVLAASAALCHEFAHVVLGHLQDRVRPSDKIIRADEVSADFRAGVLVLGLFKSRLYKKNLQKVCNVRTAHDFVESALIGFASLCTVLQTVHQESKIYHTPAVRVTHFMAGFLSIILRTKFMVEPQIQKRYLAALAFLRSIGESFDDPSALNTVMSGHVIDEKIFWAETTALMDERVTFALNQSPLLAPHRDRSGPFK